MDSKERESDPVWAMESAWRPRAQISEDWIGGVPENSKEMLEWRALEEPLPIFE